MNLIDAFCKLNNCCCKGIAIKQAQLDTLALRKHILIAIGEENLLLNAQLVALDAAGVGFGSGGGTTPPVPVVYAHTGAHLTFFTPLSDQQVAAIAGGPGIYNVEHTMTANNGDTDTELNNIINLIGEKADVLNHMLGGGSAHLHDWAYYDEGVPADWTTNNEAVGYWRYEGAAGTSGTLHLEFTEGPAGPDFIEWVFDLAYDHTTNELTVTATRNGVDVTATVFSA